MKRNFKFFQKKDRISFNNPLPYLDFSAPTFRGILFHLNLFVSLYFNFRLYPSLVTFFLTILKKIVLNLATFLTLPGRLSPNVGSLFLPKITKLLTFLTVTCLTPTNTIKVLLTYLTNSLDGALIRQPKEPTLHYKKILSVKLKNYAIQTLISEDSLALSHTNALSGKFGLNAFLATYLRLKQQKHLFRVSVPYRKRNYKP